MERQKRDSHSGCTKAYFQSEFYRPLPHSVLTFLDILFHSFHQLALIIIGKCGFGFSFNWFTPPKSHDGKMPVQEALKIVSETHMIALFLPKWIKNLPIKRYVALIPHYPATLTHAMFFSPRSQVARIERGPREAHGVHAFPSR